MVEVDSRELICLHLEAFGQDRPDGAAPRALTATGIGDALELGETSADRVEVLNDLQALEAADLVAPAERPVEGFDAPRTVYTLTPAGRERTAALRDRLHAQSVVVTNGTESEVRLYEIEHYLDEATDALVTALARLTDEGTVPLDRPQAAEFVDRDAALDSATESIETSFSRESRTLLVRGTTGIGKTALLLEAIEDIEADRPDLLTARGNCEPEPTAPYQPFMQAIEQLPNAAELRTRIEAARSAVSPGDREGLEAQRTALFNDIADGIREASTGQPIVLFLDNLHWAGEPTLGLFDHLATEIDELVFPVAFVSTTREDVGRLDTGTAVDEIGLRPLEPSDARALIAGVAGSQQVPEDFFDYVYGKTGGNPLYIRETVMHLKEIGRLDPETGTYPSSEAAIELPASVTDQIEERLGSLDDASRDLIRVGAIIGERIPGGVLAEAVDLPPADRREYVDVLIASRLWEPVAEDYRFTSGGVREAVVARLDEDASRPLHHRVAQAYLAVFGTDLSEEAARVAHHFELAGEPDQAIEYYRRAGDHARTTYANQEAIDHYQRAIELDQDAGTLTASDRADIRADLAAVHNVIGAYDRAIEVIEAGFQTVPAGSRAECELFGQQAVSYVDQGAYEAALEAANHQRRLAARLEAPDLRLAAIRQLGNVAFREGRYDDALSYYEDGLTLARDGEDEAAEAHILSNLGMVAFRRGRLADAEARYRDSLERAETHGDRQLEAQTRNALGAVAFKQGRYEAARGHYEHSREIAESIGDRQAEGQSLNNLGLVTQRLGRYEEAREVYHRSLELRRKIGDRPGEAVNLDNLGLVAQRQGRYEDAREHYQAGLAISRETGERPAEARTLNNLGMVAIRSGRPNEAEEYLQRSLDITDEIGAPETAADARFYLGLLAFERGNVSEARTAIEAAVESFESIDDRFGVAEATLAAARVAFAAGRTGSAMELVAEAQTTFAGLGADHWDARCELLLGRLEATAGHDDAALDYWRSAVATFRDRGAVQDALGGLQQLVSSQATDSAEAAEWCRTARDLLAEAPTSVAQAHRDWVEECSAALLGD